MIVESFSVNDSGLDRLHRKNFDIITEKRPSPNIPLLDKALIQSIANGKKQIYSYMQSNGLEIDNSSISALYNAFMLVRAVEDYKKSGISPEIRYLDDSFLIYWQSSTESIAEAITSYMNALDVSVPFFLLDVSKLSIFAMVQKGEF